MRAKTKIFLFSSLLVVLLTLLDLGIGSTWMSPLDLFNQSSELNHKILVLLRLPRVLTATLAGLALSVSGLMMQTLFRNPLAGPYILGVSGGAGLGVAILTMCGGMLGVSLMASWGIALAAVVGSSVVLMGILVIARHVKSNTTLLIVGMMVGSIAGALVSLIQNYANPDALKLFIVWTLGSLNGVGWSQMPIMAGVVMVGLALSVGLIKPLDGLMLGDDYARGLGVRVEHARVWIVVATGLLAGGVTAFCGPIAFIGVAVPHIARRLVNTSSHRITLPLTAMVGVTLMLACDILCNIGTYTLPISTMSALFGAPIVLWVILRK